MMHFPDKDPLIDRAKENLDLYATDAHPEDRVMLYDDLAKYATEQARQQQETNERIGTPER